jgi:hypothetical protein
MIMNNKQIRQEIRNILYEIQFGRSVYSSGGGLNKFPYNEDEFVGLPEDINTKEEYLVNWVGISGNQDLYNFPMEEFKKGMEVEKTKNNIFNILDIAEIVINNLEVNPRFYSNLGI